ncbi:MAG TPA: YibE/F family protein [Micromonosporaceae bacterium]
MGDNHSRPSTPAPPRVRRILASILAPLFVATVIATILLWPTERTQRPSADAPRYAATVTRIVAESCPPLPDAPDPAGPCGTATVRVHDGPDAGRRIEVPLPTGPGAPTVQVGDDVVLALLSDPADPTLTAYAIADHQRGRPLLWLVGLCAAVVVAFGRWRGVAALAGLATSFAVLLAFILPAIGTGGSPLPVAVTGAALIMFVVLYLTHGVTAQTSVAVLGTLASLVLTGVLATVATAAAHLTGFGSEEAVTLSVYQADVDLHGLLLAGIIIGSLGVLDDVTVTQAATVAELAHANPELTRRQLYRAATRVGRAHIASAVNTIVLAYAGASLPLLLLVVAGGGAVGDVLTAEYLAQEIVRSVVSTVGLVAAVPITTGLAALVVTAGRRTGPARQSRARADRDEALAALAGAADRRPWESAPAAPSRTD